MDQHTALPHRVLLTGATGFLGGHLLTALLDQGCAVCAIVRPCSDRARVDPRASIEVHEGGTEDLVRIVSDYSPTAAIHAATNFIARHSSADITPLIQSNIVFGAQLLNALAINKVHNLINFGTAWQHSASGKYSPTSLYAATKQAFEALIQLYVDNGLKAMTLKLSDTYGPGDSRPKVMNLLLQHAKSGKPIDLSPGEQKLNFVHVSDVTDAIVVALQQVSQGAPRSVGFAVRGQEVFSLREIAALIEAVSGARIDARWGARPYREREVMVPWLGEMLPDWQPKINLRAGLADLIAAEKMSFF